MEPADPSQTPAGAERVRLHPATFHPSPRRPESLPPMAPHGPALQVPKVPLSPGPAPNAPPHRLGWMGSFARHSDDNDYVRHGAYWPHPTRAAAPAPRGAADLGGCPRRRPSRLHAVSLLRPHNR